jgi:hypothetical protein
MFLRRAALARGLLIVCVASLAGACTTASGGPPDAALIARLGNDGPLLPLYQSLERLKTGKAGAPVVILQIGDSHTANDAFSGEMRARFQAEFGDAGRGVLPPGVPYNWYRPASVTVTSRGWTVVSSYLNAPGPFGIAGVRQHASRDAVMTLTADDAADLAVAEVEILKQPGGGTVEVGLEGGSVARVHTDAGAMEPVWVGVPAAEGVRTLTVRAVGDGPVDILAWRVGRRTAGVVYANLGTIGATAELPDRWDSSIVEAELKHLSPAMIVFAFGTNEGFADGTDPVAYRDSLIGRLNALRRQANNPALVIVGPPDGNRQRRGEVSPCGDPGWVVPPKLNAVRNAERQAAAALRTKFWDWRAAMGGACSMPKWVAISWAAKDHVHLLMPGYTDTADKFFENIMEGYRAYLALRTNG